MEINSAFKDIIGLLADMMSIFGISGFFTWSLVKGSGETLSSANIGVNIFALSVKTFLSIIACALIFIPAFFIHFFIILAASGSYIPSDAIWDDQKATAYTASYIFNCLWLIPVSILTISSVFTWSLTPFSRFAKALTGAKAD